MKTPEEIEKQGLKVPQDWEDGQLLGPTSCFLRWSQMYKYAQYYHQYMLSQSIPSEEEIEEKAYQGIDKLKEEIPWRTFDIISYKQGFKAAIELLIKGE